MSRVSGLGGARTRGLLAVTKAGKAEAIVAVAIGGAIGGAALDQIHVQRGVLSYPHTALFDQAWWVAPQFGLATVLMVLAARPLALAAARRTPAPTAARVGREALWFVGAYAASGVVGNRHPGALALAYGLTWLARLVGRADRVAIAVAGVVLAVGGVLYEGSLARTGAFHYTHPGVYDVPVWLAGIYLHGAPLLIAVVRGNTVGPAR